MVRRSAVSLEDVADLDNLGRAFWRAARGKRDRADVRAMLVDLDGALSTLGRDLRAGDVEVGRYVSFMIRDPKPRVIHAPCFRERVLHHALIAVIGPVLDRALVDDTFACREGKGSLRAVERAQAHARRWPWFVKCDMRQYFASIDHARLVALLERRLKDRGVLALCRRILGGFATAPGRGLPIGALTSQHFANTYLAPLDRYLLETLRVRGMVRYMDDVTWWCASRDEARATLAQVGDFVSGLGLTLHPRVAIQRSARGLPFLGFVVRPASRRLSLRRQRRYRRTRQVWEAAFTADLVSAAQLQAGYAAALGIVRDADSSAWRAAELRRRPPIDV